MINKKQYILWQKISVGIILIGFLVSILLRYFLLANEKIFIPIYVLMLIIMFLGTMKKGIKTYGNIILLIIGLIIISLNINQFGINNNCISSIYATFSGIIPVIYMRYIYITYTNNYIKLITKRIYIISNIYFFINTIIMVIQIVKPGFLNSKFLANNPLYFDHITGLIGISGTHVLSWFWLLLLGINYIVYLKERKLIIKYISILESIIMFVLSSYNGNTAFFIIGPVFLVLLLKININIKQLSKIIISAFLLLTVIIIAYKFIPEENKLKQFVQNDLYNKILLYKGDNGNIGDERMDLFYHVIEYYNGNKMGTGIGSVTYGDPSMPLHFGISDISIKTCEGGIVYLLYILVVYSYNASLLICTNKKIANRIKTFLLIFLIYLFLCIYTQIFTDKYQIYFLSMIFTIFTIKSQIKELDNE